MDDAGVMMTKIASFGFEADHMDNSTVTVTYPILNAITITGYQLDLSFMPWDLPGGMFNNTEWIEVLFSMSVNGLTNMDKTTNFGNAIFADQIAKGTQNLHGNNMDDVNICRAILKAFGAAENRSIVVNGLNLPVNPGGGIVMNATHGGVHRVDFEVQGVIFYQ